MGKRWSTPPRATPNEGVRGPIYPYGPENLIDPAAEL
jgi:hypothetical protein